MGTPTPGAPPSDQMGRPCGGIYRRNQKWNLVGGLANPELEAQESVLRPEPESSSFSGVQGSSGESRGVEGSSGKFRRISGSSREFRKTFSVS